MLVGRTKPVLASTLFPEEKEPVVPPRRLEEKVIFPKDRLKRIATRSVLRSSPSASTHVVRYDQIPRKRSRTQTCRRQYPPRKRNDRRSYPLHHRPTRRGTPLRLFILVRRYRIENLRRTELAKYFWIVEFRQESRGEGFAEYHYWSMVSLSFLCRGGDADGFGDSFRIEAHIVQTLSNYEQKSASYKYAQFINPTTATTINGSLAPSPHSKPSSSTSDKAISPQSLPANSPRDGAPPLPSHPPPPPPPPPPSTAATPLALLKSFSKASGEIFRIQRSWEESSLLLSPQIIASLLPETWKLCTVENVNVDSTGMILPRRPWRFAWPVEPTRTGSIPHVVAFSRAVLEEWAKGRGIDFKLAVVDEEV